MRLFSYNNVTPCLGAHSHQFFFLTPMAVIIDNLGLASSIPGTEFNDTIFGLDLNDTIDGNAGNDFIAAGSGNDFVNGNAGNDVIFQGVFIDGNDTFGAGSGLDFIDGGDGIDAVDYTNSGFAVTLGGSGLILKGDGLQGTDQINDIETITGDSAQNNIIDGQLNAGGNARFLVDLQPDDNPLDPKLVIIPVTPSTFFQEPITFNVFNFNNVVGTGNEDQILGSSAAETIDGSAGNDVIAGRGGADLLNGGADSDRVNGNTGNDTIIGSTGNDFIDGGKSKTGTTGDVLDYGNSGFGIDLGGSGLILKGDGSQGTDQISNIETIIGDSTQFNAIDGALNASGNASFDINLEEETFVLTPEVPNTFFPEPISFNIVNFNNVEGTVNNDTIIGNLGENVILGSGGNDFLDGGEGFDVLSYEELGETSITLGALGTVTKTPDLGYGIAGSDLVSNFEVIVATDQGIRNTIDGGDIEGAQIEVNLEEEFLQVVLFDDDGLNPEVDVLNPLSFIVVNFQDVRGTAEDDTITGDSQDNLFIGSRGNDNYDGTDGVNTISYEDLAGPVTLGGSGVIVKADGGTDSILGIDTIVGNELEFNIIDGTLNAAGNASLDVNLTNETLVVTPEVPNTFFPGPITFDVRNFIDVKGTVNDDTIVGSNGEVNFFFGTTGSDSYDGVGLFNDAVLFYEEVGPVIFNAAEGTAVGSGSIFKSEDLSTDTLSNVSEVVGEFGEVNVIDGLENADSGSSFDVNLKTETLIVNQVSTNKSFSVENFIDVNGTNNADLITGNGSSNVFDGNNGDDIVNGKGGSDNIFGDDGSDELRGNGGNDILTGGNGDDFIRGGNGNDIISGVGDENGANDFDVLKGDTGEDIFFLGDGINVFYEGIGFANILKFETGVDTLALTGVASDYTFENTSILREGDLIASFNRSFDISDIDFLDPLV